jgi:hypothetical protein
MPTQRRKGAFVILQFSLSQLPTGFEGVCFSRFKMKQTEIEQVTRKKILSELHYMESES